MRKLATVFFIYIFCVAVFSQKLEEPQLLGRWTYGEDPSEFLNHRILDTSYGYLSGNPDGKLVIRLCSSKNFSEAFVTTALNPFQVVGYNSYHRVISPENIYVARSEKCLSQEQVECSEYWFVPSGHKIGYEEKFPIENIYYKNIEIYEFEEINVKKLKAEFDKNISAFIEELKKHPKSEGFIIHNSNNEKMKRNIGNVLDTAKKEGIDIGRIKTLKKPGLDVNEKGKIYFVKDEKKSFPNLAVIEIEKIKL